MNNPLFETIYNQIHELEVRFPELLQQEFMKKDVAAFKYTVQKASKGSPEAVESLRKDGVQTLHGFEDKLCAAITDKEHIMEESPTVKESTTSTIHHLSEASALVIDAKDKQAKALT